MKMYTFLSFLLAINAVASVYSQNTRFTLDARDKTIKEVFKSIEAQSKFRFFYNDDFADLNSKTDLIIENMPIDEILNKLVVNSELTYRVLENDLIVITPKENNQQIKVTGTVIDATTGEPIPGVYVIIEGTQTGVVTAVNGKYGIEVPDQNAVLVFSYIGYMSERISVAGNLVIDVSLVADIQNLEEVVVVGYGTQKKTSATVAVSAIKPVEIASKPVLSINNSLAGRMSGMFSHQASGQPGSDAATLTIRGVSTTGESEPLTIVDGIPRSISSLDPNAIEDITILKDAAAVAPYGMAGANGVILVTTKKGKSGAPLVAYNAYVGFQNPTRVNELVNSYEYAVMRNEALVNDGLAEAYSAEDLAGYKAASNGTVDDRYGNSNALDEIIMKNQSTTRHNIQISGGNDMFRYYASVGYSYQEGMWSTSKMNRFNGTMNLDAQVTNITKVSLNVSGYNQESKNPSTDIYTLIGDAFRSLPISPVRFSNGLWAINNGSSIYGDVYGSGYNKGNATQLMTSLVIEQELPFISGLSVKGTVNYDPRFYDTKIWQTPINAYTVNTSTNPYEYNEGTLGISSPSLAVTSKKDVAMTYQGILNYQKSFGLHNLSALAVIEARTINKTSLSLGRSSYQVYLDEIDNGSTDQTKWTTGGTSSEARQVGYVYRLSYNYNNKYLVETAGRYDGHYYFAPGHRFGFFPSVSLGWNIGEENFLKDRFSWMTKLKLRTSYGESGNLAGEAFQYSSNYTITNGYPFDGTVTLAAYETIQGNPNITWERAKKFDVGFEISLLNNMVSFEADYFYEKRSNMLVTPDATVSYEYGVALSEVNEGIMENRGIDFSLNIRKAIKKDLTVGALTTFSYTKNKLLEVFETETTYNNPNRRLTGRPYNTEFGLKSIGYFQEDDFNADGSLKEGIPSLPYTVQAGDIRYADVNGIDSEGNLTGAPDGEIDENDIVPIGESQDMPGIIWGFAPSVTFKGFDLNMLFQGAGKYSLWINGGLMQPFFQSGSATKLQYEDHWTPENTDARYPRLSSSKVTNNHTWLSSHWMRKGNYMRLKSLELGYTLPSKITNSIKMSSVRVFMSGQNLFTWTPDVKEKIDPESGNDYGYYYYQQSVYAFGLNVTF